MTRDCRHSTEDDQRLLTYSRHLPRAAYFRGGQRPLDIVQEMTRDCR
ncbi:unnamed protein product, partial [Staurois parvus]